MLTSPPVLRSALARELSARVAAAQAKTATPVAPTGANRRHAAFAVLRAARLTGVANWMQSQARQSLGVLGILIRKRLLDLGSSFDTASLPLLLAQLESDTNSQFSLLESKLQSHLDGLLAVLTEHAQDATARHFGPKTNEARTVSEPLVLGAPLREHVEKIKLDLLFRLRATLRQAAVAGDTAQEALDRLGLKAPVTRASSLPEPTDVLRAVHRELLVRAATADSAISVGIKLLDLTDNSIAKFVQAAVTALASIADMGSFPAQDRDVRMGFTWVSAADAAVCPFCEAMDGQQWDANKEPVDGAPDLEVEPPAHINCRCSLLPCDLDDDTPAGSFSSYLNHFTDAEQKEAFGEKNVAMYRRGELTPAQLMGQQTHETSLEDFRKMEPQLRLDVAKYGKLGEQSAQSANERTAQRRKLRQEALP